MDLAIQFGLEDILCVAPALLLFLTSIIPLTMKVLRGNKELQLSTSLAISLAGLAASLVAAFVLYSKSEAVFYAFYRALVFDGMSAFSTIMVIVITSVAVLFSKEHLATKASHFSEYLFLVLNSAIGMLILSWSNDLIVTFIGIEMMSLCLYLLIVLSKEEMLSKEASFKYFVLGSLASAFFLYGLAFIYGIAGTSYIDSLAAVAGDHIATSYLFLMGVIFLVFGLGFKVSLAPFHAWTPDVYEGSPTPLTAFMATGVKLVTFVAFLRVLIGGYVGSDLTGGFLDVLQWIAVLTMLVGNLGALVQQGLKRMLAYSSIAHSGYLMMGLIAGAVGGHSWMGATGVAYYAFAYTIMTLGAFGVLCLLERHEADLVLVDDLKGLASKSPWLAAFFTIFMISLAGIPPTLGFFGKFTLFSAAIKQGFFWMVVWAVVNSVISVYYYLKPVVMMYMHESESKDFGPQKEFSPSGLAVAVMAGLVLLLGLAAEPVYSFIVTAVRSL